MSIQLAAKHLAAHGRGPDTTLVHMTPGEVASLQALAQQHGGSLSINPQTGLPEAGFLSALLPMAAGAGLAAMGMPAGYAALSVGAASALTNGGDLKQGLMNGISAYGGAGMAESFMGAGLGTMGGAMGTSTAAPATVLEAPVGATSPYALTGSTAAAAPSATGYSLGEPSSFLNQPLPSLVSTAPAQVAQAAAAATPAAQAAQQAAALDSMSMGQRFDALKAGATGTNALNYIKANPFTSLGVATAAMTPDENNTPQKAADTDRGPRAGMRFYPGYGTSLPAPNMQGIEQTYNRPYYAAEGGVTRMATGGITSAPRNQQQLFADYLQRVSSSGVAATPPTDKYDWWKNPNDPAPAAPAPAETAEEYAARMRVNARGGGGGRGEKPEPSAWDSMTDTEKTEYYAQRPFESSMANMAGTYLTKGLGFGVLGMGMDAANGPGYVDKQLNILRGIHPPANSPLAGGPIQYTTGTSEIDRVTADDAANAAYQRDQAEAANLARMQADTYPSGNFADAPLSSRTDVSGYPLRESELKSFERGLTPTAPQTSTVDYSTGLYNDLSNRPDSSFPAGTNYTDKAFTRDVFGNVLSPDAPYTSGATTSSNMALVRQNAIAGSDMQRALDSQAKTTTPYSAADEADRMFAAPDIVGINEISADPNADKTAESLGIPSAETFAAMIGAPIAQTAALNTGVVSDAGVLGGVPAPNMGYGQGRGAFGIGGVWTNREGVPITTRDGSPVMTGAGAEAMQRAVAESNEAANRTYGNAPEGRTGRDATAGDGYGGGYGAVAPGYTGGSEAADGGLSTPYGFQHMANGGLSAMAAPYDLGSYSDGGRLLKGPGDGVSDSIPATIGKGRPARLADGEFVIPARIVSEIGNGSTEAGARKLYAMMDRIQAGRKKSVGKGKVAVNSRADKYLPA